MTNKSKVYTSKTKKRADRKSHPSRADQPLYSRAERRAKTHRPHKQKKTAQPQGRPATAPKRADPFRITRKVLAALLRGFELVRLPGRGWRLVSMLGHVVKVKAKIVRSLIRDELIDFHDCTDWTAIRCHINVFGAALLSQIPRAA